MDKQAAFTDMEQKNFLRKNTVRDFFLGNFLPRIIGYSNVNVKYRWKRKGPYRARKKVQKVLKMFWAPPCAD